MVSVLISIISIALVAAFLVATVMYIDMPFGLVNDHKMNAKISQHYIDFGAILNSADGLEKEINDNQDIIDFNTVAPDLSGYYYNYYRAPTGERVLYNTHINANDCLSYEKKVRKNKSLTFDDITRSSNINDYTTNNQRNYSCYINSIDGNRYVVFIYPFSFK